MGNLCGKVDKDPFDSPGRTLGGSAPAAAGGRPAQIPSQPKTTSSVPKSQTAQKPVVGGPPRTLGGGGGSSSSGANAADARARAAAAAEVTTGKLGSKLEAQRRESRGDTLKKASENEVRQREMDAAAEAASHN